jgi:hypothetical protein
MGLHGILAHHTDGIDFHPAVAEGVSANGAHDVADFGLRPAVPWDRGQPLFDAMPRTRAVGCSFAVLSFYPCQFVDSLLLRP